MENNSSRIRRETLLSEAMMVLQATKQKLSLEHPELFQKMRKIMADIEIPDHSTEDIQKKNKITILKYLKLRKLKK